MRPGTSRPTPAVNHTGVPLVRATAAAARELLMARAASGPTAAASRRTRSASAAAAAVPVTGTSVTATSARSRTRTSPDPSLERIDDEDVEVAAPAQCVGDEVRPAEHAHRRVLGDRVGQRLGGAVLLELVGRLPRLAHRLGGGQHP